MQQNLIETFKGHGHNISFFIDGTSQAHIPLALFLLSVVAMSVLFAWLVNRTAGSVVAALVLHTAINFWPSVVPVLPTEASYRAYGFVVTLLVLLSVLVLMAFKSSCTTSISFIILFHF